MQIIINKIILLAICCFASVHSNASPQSLERFFTQIATLHADFEQRVVDETGMLLNQSHGTFSLSRPGKFRWDYASGDPDFIRGQQIVADGDYLYLYDPDLEQLIQRSLVDALGQVPSLLLVQTGADTKKHFEITHFGLTDGLTWTALKPREEDAGYQQLMLGFRGELVSQILLLDGLGNETRLTLSNVVENVEISDSRFEFVPPHGTDILFQ